MGRIRTVLCVAVLALLPSIAESQLIGGGLPGAPPLVGASPGGALGMPGGTIAPGAGGPLFGGGPLGPPGGIPDAVRGAPRPSLDLPPRLEIPELPLETGQVDSLLDQLVLPAANEVLDQIGNDDVGRPDDPNVFEITPLGHRALRGEVMVLSPSEAALAAVQAMDFSLLRDETLDGLDMRIVILGVPGGMSANDALNALRMADPVGVYEFNHIYDPSAAEPVSLPVGRARPSSTAGRGAIIGIVDSGADHSHPNLKDARIVSANVVLGGASPATAHGTAVASLLVGRGTVNGVVPEATLYIADVFGGQAAGGAAESIIRGFSWLAEADVPVINVNLVGPPNRLLEAAVEALAARGIVVVAAVGNTGPASPVGYPAAYEDVVAVTSVDHAYSVQLDANRGPEVEFAAYGVDVLVAAMDGGSGRATGTSFAAPLVAARFALEMAQPGSASAAETRRTLQSEALDLGEPARDPVFGFGFLDMTSLLTATASESDRPLAH